MIALHEMCNLRRIIYVYNNMLYTCTYISCFTHGIRILYVHYFLLLTLCLT